MKKRFPIIAIIVAILGLFGVTLATSDYIYESTIDWVNTLTICDPDDSRVNACVTIMDRNLWATKSGTICNSANSWICWYQYQWWNNYGFEIWCRSNWCEDDVARTAAINIRVDTTWYGPQNYYSWNIYRAISVAPQDWSESRNDNLRWWAWDNENNNRWYDIWTNSLTNVEDRKGPCPDWYHIPSQWERKALSDYWLNYHKWEEDVGLNAQFQRDFLIPSLPTRYVDDGRIAINDNDAEYRSSSPYSGIFTNWIFAHYFKIDNRNHQLSVWGAVGRASATPIRCFKNYALSYFVTWFDVKLFDWNIVVWSWEIKSWYTLSKAGNFIDIVKNYTNSNSGYVLKWYESESIEEFDFKNTAIESDLDLYARWQPCPNGYTVINNKCISKKAWVYYENWYIQVTDGGKSIYLRDRNVGWVSDVVVKYMRFYQIINHWYNECDDSSDWDSCMIWKYLNGLEEVNSTLETNYDNIYDANIDIVNNVLDDMEGDWKLIGQEMQKLRLSIVNDILDESCQYSSSGWDECYDNYMLYCINDVFNTGYNQIEDAWNYVYEYIWQENRYNMHDYSIINGYALWNYYYRWNNNGVKYTDLKINYDNWIITNMETLEKKWFTWWRLWEPDTWWEKDSWLENPCNGEWEYLPSREDWLELMTLYWDINGYEMKDYSCSDDGENYECYGSELAWNGGDLFVNDMLIPDGGYIYYNWDGNTYYSQDLYLWTASDKWYVGDVDYSWLYYMTSKDMRNNWFDYWNNVAMPVRCFLNPEHVESAGTLPSYTVVYKDGDKTLFTKSVKEWKFARNLNPWDKEWYIFKWWYTDSKMKNEFNFDTPITNNITLYAKWKEYGMLYKDGYIKITDGDDSVYINDKNQWAENSISLINNISDLMDEYEMCQLIAIPVEQPRSLSVQDMSELEEEFFAKVWVLIWNNNLDSCEEIYEYIGNISPLTLWSYYFRWNNNWINYTDLDIDYNNNWEIRNWNSLDSEFLSWWRLWNDEWKWWIKWNINPCTWENEYLPTPDDWEKLLNLYAKLKGYRVENNGNEYQADLILENEYWDKISIEFEEDMLIPSAGDLLDIPYVGHFHIPSTALRTAQDEIENVWYYNDWHFYYWDAQLAVDMMDWNSFAMPVRCFLNITESDDEEDTPSTPTTPTYTPSHGWSSGGWRTWVTKTDEDKTHGSADDQKSETQTEPEKQDTPKVPEVKPWANLVDDTPTTQPSNSHGSATTVTSTPAPTYTAEFKSAYSFAKTYWITNKESIQDAKMYTELTRIQMAKMLSQYAINVLGQTPDYSRWVVSFNDVSNKLNKEYDNAVTLAYQLWIMWINMKNNNFRPRDTVTRAEFATALSRMLYWIEDGKWKTKYYEPHIAKLYNEWIINNTNAKMVEKRWYVMTMLMRTVR